MPREPSVGSPPLSDVDELALIERARTGDALALSELMDRLAPWVGRLCAPIALDHGADAAQETLIQVLRDVEGLSEHEAATQLEIARGTAKSRLHRARMAFIERWMETWNA